MKQATVTQIGEWLSAKVEFQGHADRHIRGIGGLEYAGPEEITYLSDPSLVPLLMQGLKAGVVIVKSLIVDCPITQIVHPHPQYAFGKVAARLYSPPRGGHTGVSDKAYVAASAVIGAEVIIHPFAYIGEEVRIGDGAIIYSQVTIGDGCSIGEKAIIYSGVSIYHGTSIGRRVVIHSGSVIGADGFGCAHNGEELIKLPQIGSVIIEDDVEIGSQCSIARGAFDDTVIGRGTKTDALIHVGHNVKIGENCIICGQSGVAGSSSIGSWVTMAGQSGVSDHIKISDRVVLGARCAAIHNIDKPDIYLGFPATSNKEFWNQQALNRRLPQMNSDLRALKKEVAALKGDK